MSRIRGQVSPIEHAIFDHRHRPVRKDAGRRMPRGQRGAFFLSRDHHANKTAINSVAVTEAAPKIQPLEIE
jgi:hypothetical protein